MKKIIFLLSACILLSLPLQAKKVYMTMVWGDNGVHATVDDGTALPRSVLKNDEGKKIEFKTEISALNYLSSFGWELFQVTTEPDYLLNDKYFYIKTTYILVKDVSDEEMEKIVKEGIIPPKIDFKSKSHNPDEELPEGVPVLE